MVRHLPSAGLKLQLDKMTTELPVAARRSYFPFARWGIGEVVLGAPLLLLVAGGLALTPAWPLAVVPLGAAGILLWFFRDPHRVPQGRAPSAIAPADGLVVEVATVDDPWVGPGATQISIYLSVFDVHVNRIPLDGRVAEIRRHEGGYHHAGTPEAKMNAAVWTGFEGGPDFSSRFSVRQITGLVARRIVCDIQPGELVHRGSRFGMIKFGSRTEIVLPATYIPQVSVGQRVKGGETVVAEISTK